MSLRLLYFQSFHQPAVLLCCYLPYLLLIPRPLVNTAFQPLVQKDKSILLPIQALDPIPATSAKQKQCIREWVQVKLLLNQDRKTVDPFPQICVSAGNVDVIGSGEVI